ncbi:MAG: AAA family ATPase [Lachnospiraceae bacterium]|nr:AAA family ATPase [Lachnospiraceae bacterium]
MQLKIKNVAKIKEAEVNIDGITVIAGENDTGKSTIGKLLFSIFNSMNNLDKKIEQEKEKKIYRIIKYLLQSNYIQNPLINTGNSMSLNSMSRRIAQYISELIQNNSIENFQNYIEGYIKNDSYLIDKIDLENFVEECAISINDFLKISDKKVMMEAISIWFNRVFVEQISPLNESDEKSEINLLIKESNINFVFKNNVCIDWKSELNVLHQAFYIDNPFIIDSMSNNLMSQFETTDSHLLRHLSDEEVNIYEGIFDAVMAKDKLEDIYSMLSEIIDGEFIGNPGGEYYLKLNNYDKPINIKNLSTGLKSFALIKRLLENGSLKEKDVLILDEPEIHLHPEWQLIYAQMIVLLQKEFDLTMIITTHSPYFLDAIDVFTTKYKISDRVNYYLSENDGEVSYLSDVTDNIDAIYKKLSDPLQMLENIRNEIGIDKE